jgi:small subunit ribosomal protein S5
MQKKFFKERAAAPEEKIKEKMIHINRVAKVVKGGRRFSFSALVVVGDQEGSVGLGFGKANEVAEAIRKAIQSGKNNMFKVNLSGSTIPYEITTEYGAAKVFMKPASPGTGIIAGGAVRAIVEMSGIKDILTKNLGTKNPINAARATIEALRSLRSPEEYALRRAIEPEEPKKKKKTDRKPGEGVPEDAAPESAAASEVEEEVKVKAPVENAGAAVQE